MKIKIIQIVDCTLPGSQSPKNSSTSEEKKNKKKKEIRIYSMGSLLKFEIGEREREREIGIEYLVIKHE